MNSETPSERSQRIREKAKKANKGSERKAKIARFALFAAVGVIVVSIIGGAWFFSSNNNKAEKSTTTLGESVPNGVKGPNWGTPPVGKSNVKVEAYEDFQCPGCGMVERNYGADVAQLVNSNKISISYFPMTFLDANLKNDSSVLATNAFGCAVDEGKTVQYHAAVFAQQPQQEGAGYTVDQLKTAGKTAGITGASYDRFVKCVDSNVYNGWGAKVDRGATARGVVGTPTIFVNGKELSRDVYSSKATFLKALQGK